MKKKSKMESKTEKEKELEKKQESLQIMESIMNDYNAISNEDKKSDIYKWQILGDTVICKAFNNFTAGKTKLLSFDLDDTLITFSKKK